MTVDSTTLRGSLGHESTHFLRSRESGGTAGHIAESMCTCTTLQRMMADDGPQREDSAVGLDREIADRRAEIRSDGYSMSIGEIISLYRDDELDMHPEFQRFYRWSDEQKSRLVESILLGIPVPSIFVSQREDGVWDVIDGQQRLSTIFQLVGCLKDESRNTKSPLKLKKTKYLPSLEGKLWHHEDPSKCIGAANQLLIRRSKIDVKIILRESTESSKYELFQRLNTGGSQLSDQELRNAILLMVKPDAYRWIEELAKDENFEACIALSDRLMAEQYNLELVTRFVVFRDIDQARLRSIGDIGDFLTDSIVDIAESDAFREVKRVEEQSFRGTFAKLAESLGDRSFRRYDTKKQRHMGGFSISAFEPIALGLGFNNNYKRFNRNGGLSDIVDICKELWENEDFRKRSGSGVRASTRVLSSVPLGRELFGS